MRGNWGMNSWKLVVCARCAGSLQVGLLERKVHATTARQRALQHWDFGKPKISFSSHIQTKRFQQRPPPEKSLKLAACQTRPVGSQFWQRFCSYPKLGTGQASIIILSIKNAILPPRPQDEKTYPEVVSRSTPRTLKDFCQRACSQKIRRAPREKKNGPHKSAVSVPSVSFSRDSTVYVLSVKFVVSPVLRFLYRPYFFVFKPPLATKILPPPPLTTPACVQMGPSCCSPFVDHVLSPKTHKGGEENKKL